MDTKELARDLTIALAKRVDIIVLPESTDKYTKVAQATVYLYKEIIKALEADRPKGGTVQVQSYA